VVDGAPGRVVAMGIDAAAVSGGDREAGRRRFMLQRSTALFLGRLVPVKGLDLLLDALPDGLDLVIAGDGPLREALARRLPQALFAGQRRDEDLAAHYASADLFLFPSLTETFGNVTLEAMASGLAVVAFGYAAAADVIRHGASGLLAPYGDTDAFARLAAGLAASPSRATDLGAHARYDACSRGWDRVVQQLEASLLIAADAGPANKKGRALHPSLATSPPQSSREIFQITPVPGICTSGALAGLRNCERGSAPPGSRTAP